MSLPPGAGTPAAAADGGAPAGVSRPRLGLGGGEPISDSPPSLSSAIESSGGKLPCGVRPNQFSGEAAAGERRSRTDGVRGALRNASRVVSHRPASTPGSETRASTSSDTDPSPVLRVLRLRLLRQRSPPAAWPALGSPRGLCHRLPSARTVHSLIPTDLAATATRTVTEPGPDIRCLLQPRKQLRAAAGRRRRWEW